MSKVKPIKKEEKVEELCFYCKTTKKDHCDICCQHKFTPRFPPQQEDFYGEPLGVEDARKVSIRNTLKNRYLDSFKPKPQNESWEERFMEEFIGHLDVGKTNYKWVTRKIVESVHSLLEKDKREVVEEVFEAIESGRLCHHTKGWQELKTRLLKL